MNSFLYDALITPSIIVPISTDGNNFFPFVLDTGFNSSVVFSRKGARRLGVNSSGERYLNKASGATTTATHPVEIIMGVENRILYSLPYAHISELKDVCDVDTNVSGLVGLGLLNAGVAYFDFQKKAFAIFRPLSINALGTGTHTAFFTKNGSLFRYVSGDFGNNVLADLLVDTGCESLVLSKRLISRLGFVRRSKHRIKLKTVNGLIDTERFLVPQLTIGSITRHDVPAVVGPTDASYLGLEFLSKFQVTMDFVNSFLHLKTPELAEDPKLCGWTGIILERRRGILGPRDVVKEVADGSPAAQSGIRTGDTIIGVDSHCLSYLPIAATRNIINGYDATPMKISLSRGFKRHRVTVEPTSEYQ